MSDSSSRLPANPSLEQLQKQAKDLLNLYRAGDCAALQRFPPATKKATLAHAQFVIAREHGFESWAKLKHHIGALTGLCIEQYEQLAHELARAHMSADSMAIRALNRTYGTEFLADFHQQEEMRQQLTSWYASDSRTPDLALSDARQMVARSLRLRDWRSLLGGIMPPFFQVDGKKSSLTVKGLPSGGDWERVFAVMKEYGITRLHASGLTDPSVQLLAKLDQVISLTLRSDVLTDDGLAHLASMPQLCELEISGPNITDRGLQVLRHLSNLRRFQSCWTQAISDAGAANLASCDLIESVNLLGTAAGDGLIAALAGKLNLRQLKTGYGVSDAGIKILQQIPAFKTWLAEDVRYCLMSAETQPNHLLIDGPFTDAGLADLAGLEGLFGLSFFRHSEFFTAAGLAPLRLLPNLGFFGCPGTRCDDEALSHIAAMPHLRMLLGQGAVAGDAGWKRLSQSQTIEYIWGRDCPNFTSSGLYALAAMPALRGIGISCKQVDDAALSTLPSFPALRHLMPMDVSDSGFRHLGRCEKLEGLWCMYCRDTGDVATAHIEPLSRLKTYYAGMTKITDRSLEILSRMLSLENLEFYGCNEITDRGIAHLAKLPQLYEISVQSSTRVSAAAAALFPPHVSVSFSG